MRKSMTAITVSAVLAVSTVFMPSSSFAHCGACGAKAAKAAKADASCSAAAACETKKDLIGVAQEAGSFNTLIAAVKAAGLAETLQGKGPFTVFAPSDDAFAKLPKGTVENLLKPENKQKLISILTYHVAPGSVASDSVIKLNGVQTVNGQRAAIKVNEKTVSVDHAKVVAADVKASNGVIHVIDSVILPEEGNIVQVADKAGQFNTLIAAAKAAGLAEALTGDEHHTVFAPTDEAFSNLPEGTVESLLLPENREALQNILKLHIVPGRVYSEKVLEDLSFKSLAESTLNASIQDGQAKIAQSAIIATDINASNGVIHVIDRVILPSDLTEKVSMNN